MPDSRDVVKKTVESLLRNDGWRKVHGDWKKRPGALLLLVNLQKSNFAPAYYLNIGVEIDPDADWNEIGIDDAAIDLRLEDLEFIPEAEVRRLLSLTEAMPDDDRVRRIELVLSQLLELLNCAETIADLQPGGRARRIVDQTQLLSLRAKFLG